MSDRTARLLFLIGLVFLAYGFGAFSQRLDWIPASLIGEAVDHGRTLRREWPVITGQRPKHHLSHRPGSRHGVTLNRYRADSGGVVLVSSFFDGEPGLRAMRRDGTVLAHWVARYSELFPKTTHTVAPPATDWNADVHGAVLLADGSVVFNFEYLGLARIDRCGDTRWTLERITHHSVEQDEQGNIWVAGQRKVSASEPSQYRPFPTPYLDDTVLKLSPDGELLDEFSVIRLLIDNQLESLMTVNAEALVIAWRKPLDLVHLNKVTPLGSDRAGAFREFDTGDLALSLPMFNLLMVVDPQTRRIKWHQVGPWLRQHDPEFTKRGTLLVFNNNDFWNTSNRNAPRRNSWQQSWSNVLEADPLNGVTRVFYAGAGDYRIHSVTRGKIDLLDNGNVLITEFDGGRALEVTPEGEPYWEYVNRYDNRNVLEITEARVYPDHHFSFEDWRCKAPPSSALNADVK